MMAIVLDDQVKSAMTRRRAHGQDPRILLYIERLRLRSHLLGENPEVLSVGWVPDRWPVRTLVARRVGDSTVIMETRLARYTETNDLAISAWRLGPIDRLMVEPAEILAVEEWERTHGEDRPRRTLSPSVSGADAP